MRHLLIIGALTLAFMGCSGDGDKQAAETAPATTSAPSNTTPTTTTTTATEEEVEAPPLLTHREFVRRLDNLSAVQSET